MIRTGTLYGVGIGPGDPELMTLKAARIIETAPVIAFFAKRGRPGHARTIAGGRINPDAEELRLEYPFTTELAVDDPRYSAKMNLFYDEATAAIAARLGTGSDVAVLCEGDPFFYGSFMYLFDRLFQTYRSEVVPGITGMSGCWTRALTPMTHGDDVVTVLPGTLSEERLADHLRSCDAAVVMKVGQNLGKIRRALDVVGLGERAIYVERGTMADERIERLADISGDVAPYFSIILVPGRQRAR